MIEIEKFRQMALAYPEAKEQPHFEKTSFRVAKKIFATLDISNGLVCLKLSEIDQDVFCSFDKTIIYPVPNKWGLQGWTLVNLANIKEEMLADVLTTAYCEVAPKKWSAMVRPDTN